MSDTGPEFKRGRGRPVIATPEQIVKHRNRLGMTHEQFAQELQVTEAEVQGFEVGAVEMDENTKFLFGQLKKRTTRKNKKRTVVDEEPVSSVATD